MSTKCETCLELYGGISNLPRSCNLLSLISQTRLPISSSAQLKENIKRYTQPLGMRSTTKRYKRACAELNMVNSSEYFFQNVKHGSGHYKMIQEKEHCNVRWQPCSLVQNCAKMRQMTPFEDPGSPNIHLYLLNTIDTNFHGLKGPTKTLNFWVLGCRTISWSTGAGILRYRYFGLFEFNPFKSGALMTDSQVEVNDPCVPKGTAQTLPYNDVFSPCTLRKGNFASPTLLQNQRKTKNALLKYKSKRSVDSSKRKRIIENNELSEIKKTPGIKYHIRGGSDAVRCQQLVGQLFQKDVCENTFAYGDCMGNSSVPTITGKLIGFSEVLVDILHILGENLTLTALEEEILKICSMDISQLQNAYPDLSDDDLENFCFDAMYVYKILVDGIGITEQTWNDVEFKSEIAGTDIQWSLGYFRSIESPPASVVPLLGPVPTILLLILFSAFLISGTSFCRHAIKIKRHSSSYQRCEYPQI
ncbi:unnamed protein product [Meganyctiphanes norvegica]|uniref:Uncharacterized protein n=1 Tax=Meganyctiphanes norvegica TaxID=48144 RepID=A0AAV2R607_MEGNR